MSNEQKHTPLPWFYGIETSQHGELGYGPTGHFINTTDDPTDAICWMGEMEPEANAEFIVRACNSHYEPVEAIEMLLNETNAGKWDCLPVDKAREALAKATTPGKE